MQEARDAPWAWPARAAAGRSDGSMAFGPKSARPRRPGRSSRRGCRRRAARRPGRRGAVPHSSGARSGRRTATARAPGRTRRRGPRSRRSSGSRRRGSGRRRSGRAGRWSSSPAMASARSTPLSRSNTTGSPVRASTAVMSTRRSRPLLAGQPGGDGGAPPRRTTEPSDAASSSSAAAPIRRRIVGGIRGGGDDPARALQVVDQPACPERRRRSGPGAVRACRAAERQGSRHSSSAGVAPAIWAAAVEPAEVPIDQVG